MARDNRRPQAGDQQRDHGKDAGFSKHGHANRHAYAEQAFDNCPFWPFKVAIDLARLVDRPAVGPNHHAHGHEPHHDGRRPATANAAHGGHAEVAVDKHVVNRDIQRQPQETQYHARLGLAQTIAETAQYTVNPYGRHATGDTVQIAHARLNQFWRYVHYMQQRFGADQQKGGTQPGNQC